MKTAEVETRAFNGWAMLVVLLLVGGALAYLEYYTIHNLVVAVRGGAHSYAVQDEPSRG